MCFFLVIFSTQKNKNQSKTYMKQLCDQRLVVEKPCHYQSDAMQEYIKGELARPSKQWIGCVLDGTQESEEIKLNTEEYLLLPDTEKVNRYWRIMSTRERLSRQAGGGGSQNVTLNWLAILKDPGIKTLRELEGKHVPMLMDLRERCLRKIEEETGKTADQVMVYLHYHPSVYQVHIHFAYPYFQYGHRDVYRVHLLDSVIHNLQVDGDYYKNASIPVSVSKESVLYKLVVSDMTSDT